MGQRSPQLSLSPSPGALNDKETSTKAINIYRGCTSSHFCYTSQIHHDNGANAASEKPTVLHKQRTPALLLTQ
jgi:hypothetical protein